MFMRKYLVLPCLLLITIVIIAASSQQMVFAYNYVTPDSNSSISVDDTVYGFNATKEVFGSAEKLVFADYAFEPYVLIEEEVYAAEEEGVKLVYADAVATVHEERREHKLIFEEEGTKEVFGDMGFSYDTEYADEYAEEEIKMVYADAR